MKKYYLYIVLTRPNTGISKIIRVIKRDKYTHAAISLNKELDQMYSFGRRKTNNPFIGRFKKEALNEGIYELCNTLPGVVIEVEVSKKQYQKAKKLVDHFINNSSLYKYNYKGLAYSLMNRPTHTDNRFLCSEFVYYILRESGVVDFKVARNLVRPQSLLDIDGRILYNGDLKVINLMEYEEFNKPEIAIRKLSAI